MPSTLKLMSCTPINSDCKKKIITIWQSIQDSNDSLQFRNPVNWKQMGLYDYLDFVKQPMDLSTIHKKLRQQKYRTVQSFLDDLQLIFDNCKIYNTSGCWIYNLADKLQKSFHKMVRNFLPKIAKTNSHSKLSQEFNKRKAKLQQAQREQLQIMDEQYLQQICYNQKIKFTQKLSHLSPQNIQKIVQVIFRKCSAAIQSIMEQRPKDKQQEKNIDNNIVKQSEENQQIAQVQQAHVQQNAQIIVPQQNKDIKSIQKCEQLGTGSKFQILVDQLDLGTFRQIIELMEHMIDQKDKVSKRIKLE